jgi:hypothetical protein
MTNTREISGKLFYRMVQAFLERNFCIPDDYDFREIYLRITCFSRLTLTPKYQYASATIISIPYQIYDYIVFDICYKIKTCCY